MAVLCELASRVFLDLIIQHVTARLFSALADTPNSDKPRLQNPRECHAQHRPRPRRNPKEITVLVLTNEDAEENARHRNDEKDPA